MRLIVLSKTHAWGRRRPDPRRNRTASPHMRFGLSLPDNDVFSGSALQGWGARADPSFTMSNRPGAMSAGPEFDCFHRSRAWWSQTGSNRRPHACKARALPTELWPLVRYELAAPGMVLRMVGPGRLELPTLRLSGVRSNHLSYGPRDGGAWRPPVPSTPKERGARWARDRARAPSAAPGEVERETKTATSRTQI